MRRHISAVGIAVAVLSISIAPPGTPSNRASAQTAARQCPAPAKLRPLCVYVSGHSEGTAGNRYRYQDVIYDAACTDADAPDRNEKIQRLWRANQTRLTCTNIQFGVTDGSIIKFAISSHFFAFVYDVTKWGVPLNKVDRTDGETALDYVEQEIIRNKGNPLEGELVRYREMLVGAGAKRARELTAAERAADATVEFREFLGRSEAGETPYMLRLARAYKDGYGGPANRPEALRWLQRAADVSLAKSHEDAVWAAEGMVDLDVARALRTYELAAAYNWRAAEALGDLYARGDKVPQNHTQAARWYARGDQLNPGTDSSLKLGLLYIQGKGVPQDADVGATLLMKTWRHPTAKGWLCANRRRMVEAQYPDYC